MQKPRLKAGLFLFGQTFFHHPDPSPYVINGIFHVDTVP
jgi:hypothetical protein